MPSLIGHAVNPPKTKDRSPINIAPEVRARLADLLYEEEMRGVGYSEFINRACELAETQIAEQRTKDRESGQDRVIRGLMKQD